MPELILASASPRRKALLRLITEQFTVLPAGIDERALPKLEPKSIPAYLAARKASAICPEHFDAIVLGADTAVFCGDEVFGKPEDADDARRMLTLLSGATHTVITGCCACFREETRIFSEETSVTFRTLTEEEILSYISGGEPFGKAGAYAIQGKGARFVSRVEGDPFNVIGLPVCRLYETVRDWLS